MGTLRITGGTYRGRKIVVSEGSLEIRPPMDRMRESIFSILGDIDGATVLDIFSGSGIFSFEALSRGAVSAFCVEKDKNKIHALKKNADLLGVKIQCWAMPAEYYIKRANSDFDLVFCDPPFPYRFKNELLLAIAEKQLIRPKGRLVFHFPQEDKLDEAAGDLKLYDTRKYGRSCVNIYQSDSIS